jgi:acetyltransferase-like isoleucine patch superfamily enzyme
MKIYYPGDSLSGVSFVWANTPDIKNNFITIGDNVTFRPPVILYWGTIIGNGCVISHNAVIREYCELGDNSKIGNNTTLDGHIKLGKNVSIHTLCFIANHTIIEDNVFIGPGCTITNVRKIKHGRKFPLIEESAQIKFGTRIGGGCTILPGVIIGTEALIGAGSVVTKNIDDYTVAIGVPAKSIKKISDDEKL